jgi:HTH-type transcriptional regulator/antitoxin MqsA
MKCPNCGAAKLVHDTRDLPYTYKGESTILPQVTGDFCPACDESILDASESRRTIELMPSAGRSMHRLSIRTSLPACARSSTSTNAKLARSSVVA